MGDHNVPSAPTTEGLVPHGDMFKTLVLLALGLKEVGSIAIKFRFAPQKAFAALQMVSDRCDSIDLHTFLKTCYFADREHLNQYGRPVFGATYRAMRYGPLPIEIYEMIKAEPLWLAELGMSTFPWELKGYEIRRSQRSNQPSTSRALSPSDRDAINRGFQRACDMTFNERTAATHGPDWQAARLGLMRYEDMLEDTETKAGLVDELRESAPFMRL